MSKYLERFWQSPVGKFATKFTADQALDGSVLIAWQALLSLFPIIIAFLSILGLVVRDPEQFDALVSTVQSQFPAQVDDMLAFLDETRSLGGLLGIIGLLGLLWSGSNLFGGMEHVFNRFYAAAERGFVWKRLMAFGMMAVYLVLIVLSIGANAAGHSIAEIADWFFGFPLEGIAAALGLVIGWIISLGSAFLMFVVLFKVVPNISLTFRQVWRGGLLSAVLFLLVNQLFPIYLQFLGSGFEAYKTFGLFLLLMTYFYFLAIILCVGAELNAFLGSYGAQTEAEAAAVRAGLPPQRGRKRKSAAAVAANGQAAMPSVGKQILWAGLTAGVTGLTMAAAQRTAAGLWRTMTGEQPPEKRS